ncbi:RidA family protein [Acinetobacter zhairhuonensis]|jgi:enamine deaminase RidA (YjgF/YER057c/UK114 family)|uniref:RidA family protein n=1 Tax=Acinetobacter sp. A7.4 TaxID=2919921 RepID=UPI001F4F69E7|nr:RidA family protein [Acinetobacter sp. A7.4]MCJ8163065.1 RidA family protein [Acinetobacter sp. A7.4]
MSQQDIQRFNTTPVMSAVTVFNNVVYLSGQVPKNPDSDITAQTQDVLNTIDELLLQANSDKSRILSAQLFLKDLADFSVVNEIWIDWLEGYATPARATIQADLVNPKWLIEIAVVAAQK